MGKWQMGGESNTLRNDDDVEGHAAGMRNADDDVEGHAWKSVEDDQVETGSEKPGDRARVKARVKNFGRNADDDVSGHLSGGARNSDDDVEGHAAGR